MLEEHICGKSSVLVQIFDTTLAPWNFMWEVTPARIGGSGAKQTLSWTVISSEFYLYRF